MSQFTSPLIVKSLGDGLWEIQVAFEYYTYEDGKKIIYTIPKGFVTNFASVPRILQSVFQVFGKHGKAAVLHDYLYSFSAHVCKKKADLLFLEAMGVLGVDEFTKNSLYYAVKFFGDDAYEGEC